MRTLWITFANLPKPSNLGLGIGVTAHDLEDAYQLVREQFGVMDIADTKDVMSIDDLEQNHVIV